jgi:serine protease Do
MKITFAKTIGLGLVAAVGTLIGSAVSTSLHGQAVHAAREVAPPSPPATVVGMDTFQNVARQEDNAVVNITTSKVVKNAGLELPFNLPFGWPMFPREGGVKQTERASGSGFVVDSAGYILTNRHVIDGADKVQVTLADGRHYDAKVIGEDARTDVALVKIEPREDLTVLPLGDSDRAQVGEWVMAVGNPFGMGGNSVTVGVVSFKGRPLDLSTHGTPVEMIQTDAAINPGNSGGPLINARGEAIGINTLIISPGARQSSGVGFAVPINVAKSILPQLRTKGHVDRGWLGIQIQGVDEDLAKSLKLDAPKGAIVADVTPDSPAKRAGLEPGDVIVKVDGQEVKEAGDLSHHVAAKAPGSAVSLTVVRDGKARTLRATLGHFPESQADLARGGEHQEHLGMQLQPLTPDLARSLGLPAQTKGLAVAEVVPGSHAEDAGLRKGDVILSVNGKAVADVGAFKAQIARAEGTGLARLRVQRRDSARFLVIKLA